MVVISPSDSVRLHELLTRGPDHFTTWFPAAMTLASVVLVQTIGWLKGRSDRAHDAALLLAGQALTRKLDSVTALWLAGAEWHDTLIELSASPAEYDHASWSGRLSPFNGRYYRSMILAQPYLTDEQLRALRLLGATLGAVQRLVLTNPNSPRREGAAGRTFDEKVWSDLDGAYTEAVECMRALEPRRVLRRAPDVSYATSVCAA